MPSKLMKELLKYECPEIKEHLDGSFELEMVDRGKWQPTPYRGTTIQLLDLLTQQFSFTLAKF
ncbi:hypothetical protein [Heliorestis convoluta]|uniref:Uncharacterized protein n=1 Tax=Heliorestis convoluta TaxID=356322 RepID=A0A5Q2N9F6_9FIRM|nr:hypothetical protein [Heliorestis convoluta]QGG48900.1 hypothetical protein FTV88_2811 [Heliorestis convoluta]